MQEAVRIGEDAEHRPLTGGNVVALALCAFALLIDGFDVYLVGNLGPAIAARFGSAPAGLAVVFLLQQSGLAIGALLISPIADRVGRKNVLLACAVAFGLLTLVAPLARTLLQFGVARALAAVFLSGLVPSAVAILVDATPRRRQGLFIALAFTGYGAGAVGGALVGALLLGRYGWQSGFWIGGLVPLFYVGLAAALLPGRIGRAGLVAPVTVERASKPAPTPVHHRGRMRATLILWSIFFLSSGTIALMLSWMPSFFVARGGITLRTYSSVASFALGGALLGTLTIGFVLDRFRPTRVAIFVYVLLAAAIEAMAHAPFGTSLFILFFTAAALFQGAGPTTLSVIVAQFHPKQRRASGIGWAFGAARVGGIVGPGLGGALMAGHASLPQFLLSLAAPLIVCALLLTLLDRVGARPIATEGLT